MTDWQPIETAPKDGTSVLLWGVWAGEIHGPSAVAALTFDIGHWAGGTSDYAGDDWWQLDTGDAYACWMRATHWLPLPPPPQVSLPLSDAKEGSEDKQQENYRG